MYSFQSKSNSIIFIPRIVEARLYIYGSQLSSVATNPQAKKKVVINDLKTRYVLWPVIKYLMYSIQSKSDSIILIPRHIKSRIYIYSSQLSSIGTNPLLIKTLLFAISKARYMLWPGIKYPKYSFQSNSDSIIFIPRRIKARMYI
jgi:hypothetical protein